MTALAEERPMDEGVSIQGVQTLHHWAKRTGVPYTILREAVHQGRLPAYRFSKGGRYYVLEDEIARFIEESKLKYRPLTP